MPTSNLALWPDIIGAIAQVPHHRVLDVGPGHGKASVLLREYLNDPPDTLDCVEMWPAYVDQFHLNRLYDRVYVGDVTGTEWTVDGQPVLANLQLPRYDLVLMGDVIEHLELEPALDLLGRIRGRTVICTPTEWFDNDPHGQHPPTEQHVSHWTDDVWERVSAIRPIEVCYATLGGWIVRLGPLP